MKSKNALEMLEFLAADLSDPLTEKISDELRKSYLEYVKRVIEKIKNERRMLEIILTDQLNT
jgi:hypothetical protein